MVTLWRTDDAVGVRVFEALFIAFMISSAPAWCSRWPRLYRPVQHGARFPRNAPMPSCASAARAFIDILNRYSMRVPNGAMPPVNTVFGNSPEPQIMNEPKSLYQSPAGAQGPAFTQSCNRRRSWREI